MTHLALFGLIVGIGIPVGRLLLIQLKRKKKKNIPRAQDVTHLKPL
jgi:hypothetical protein